MSKNTFEAQSSSKKQDTKAYIFKKEVEVQSARESEEPEQDKYHILIVNKERSRIVSKKKYTSKTKSQTSIQNSS